MNKKIIISTIIIALITLIIIGGTFVYSRKTQEIFGTKFNSMNDAYKKVLFATGQEKNESKELMTNYKGAWNDFYNSYRESPIKPYSSDFEWKNSLDKMNNIVISSEKTINENKLKDAHVELEAIRQAWQEVFTRSNVTMLGFYLTEYHDAMEKAIEYSDSKDYGKLKQTCESMKVALQNVKETKIELTGDTLNDYTAKLNDITTSLNNLCDANDAKDDVKIKEYSSKLKPTFLALYLK
jgi:hypothetical protein